MFWGSPGPDGGPSRLGRRMRERPGGDRGRAGGENTQGRRPAPCRVRDRIRRSDTEQLPPPPAQGGLRKVRTGIAPRPAGVVHRQRGDDRNPRGTKAPPRGDDHASIRGRSSRLAVARGAGSVKEKSLWPVRAGTKPQGSGYLPQSLASQVSRGAPGMLRTQVTIVTLCLDPGFKEAGSLPAGTMPPAGRRQGPWICA